MKRISLLFLLSLLAVSCAKESSDDEDGGSSAGADTPSSIFEAADNAIASTYSESSGSSLAKSSITCENGAPTSSSEGDAIFAGEDVYCVMNTNTKSPDTVQGSYYLVSKILCAIEKSESFEYSTVATNHDNVTFEESDSCFGTGFDSNEDSDYSDTVTISFTEQALTGSDYDYYIGIQLGATSFSSADVEIYLKDSDDILAAKLYQEGDETQVEFVLDSGNSLMSFENRDYNNQRHIRVAASGSFSDTGTFTSVSSAKFIHTEGAAGSEMSVLMSYDGSNDSYDHYVAGSQDADYSDLADITYDTDFCDWSGRSIGDLDPETDSILNLSTFDMAF